MNKLWIAMGLMLMATEGFSKTVAVDANAPASSYGASQSVKATADATGRIIAYMTGWKTPPAASDLAQAGYTHIIVAFGVFSTQTPGEIVSAFDTVTANYIKELQSNGIKVLLSLGGASSSIPSTTTDFHQVLTQATSVDVFSQAFIHSLETFKTQYGFDGFDFDIESGLIGQGDFANPTGDIAALAGIINTLHQEHQDWLITLAPQMANIAATQGFDATWGNYASLIMQTAPSLSWVGIQLYNSGCCYGLDLNCYGLDDYAYNPDTFVAMAADLLENWPKTDSSGRQTGFKPYISYLNPSQVVLGFPATNADNDSDGQPPAVITTIKRAILCLRQADPKNTPNSCLNYTPPRAYPNIGGVFEWEVSFDQDNNYNFATALKDCVVNGTKCD